jgi:hypothetical protein
MKNNGFNSSRDNSFTRRKILVMLAAGGTGFFLTSCRGKVSVITTTITNTETVTSTAPAPVTTVAGSTILTTTTIARTPSGTAITTFPPSTISTFTLSSPEVSEGGVLPRDYT